MYAYAAVPLVAMCRDYHKRNNIYIRTKNLAYYHRRNA